KEVSSPLLYCRLRHPIPSLPPCRIERCDRIGDKPNSWTRSSDQIKAASKNQPRITRIALIFSSANPDHPYNPGSISGLPVHKLAPLPPTASPEFPPTHCRCCAHASCRRRSHVRFR